MPIDRGYVEGYQEGQRPILHLVTTVEAAIGLGRKFAFTDGHAEMAFSEFYETLDALPTCVDWEVMRLAYWHDTDENPDRKRRRQAEFLVHEFFPWEAIIRIGVKDLNVRRDVELALLTAGHRPEVVIKLNWYY